MADEQGTREVDLCWALIDEDSGTLRLAHVFESWQGAEWEEVPEGCTPFDCSLLEFYPNSFRWDERAGGLFTGYAAPEEVAFDILGFDPAALGRHGSPIPGDVFDEVAFMGGEWQESLLLALASIPEVRDSFEPITYVPEGLRPGIARWCGRHGGAVRDADAAMVSSLISQRPELALPRSQSDVSVSLPDGREVSLWRGRFASGTLRVVAVDAATGEQAFAVSKDGLLYQEGWCFLDPDLPDGVAEALVSQGVCEVAPAQPEGTLRARFPQRALVRMGDESRFARLSLGFGETLEPDGVLENAVRGLVVIEGQLKAPIERLLTASRTLRAPAGEEYEVEIGICAFGSVGADGADRVEGYDVSCGCLGRAFAASGDVTDTRDMNDQATTLEEAQEKLLRACSHACCYAWGALSAERADLEHAQPRRGR